MGYIVTDAEGRRRAGALDAAVPPPGWSEFVRFRRPDGSTGVAQAMNSVLTGEGRLVVAADRAIVNRMDMALLKIFLVEVGLILLVIAAAAAGFARIVHVRLAAIRGSAEAIMGGDLARRMPIDSSNSEFDQLSAVLNRMLDRISALLENLRQVSSDLAHDLRTPLTRLRNRIEAAGAAAGSEAGRAELEAALRDADGVLELFTGVLAISEIEGQDLRGRFTAIRLDELVAEVAEAYEPALDAAQVTLTREFSPAVVLGHRGLLQRAVANLMDNLIGHTPAGARARVAVGASDGEVRLEVSDNGPGVPSEDAARIVERFVRLDPARSSPGHGLGLSMVAAIVAAHGGALSIRPADPGLVVRISLPAALPATAQAAA
jgi:signal transduction histidine kinase